MAAIIAQLIALFGPALVKWLSDCLEERLNDAAAELPAANTFASEGAAASALFDRAIDDLPRFALVRRWALRQMKEKAIEGDKLRTAPLDADELRAARGIAGAIRPQ